MWPTPKNYPYLTTNHVIKIVLGANSLMQGILPHLLEETPASYHEQNRANLEKHAMHVANALGAVPGLSVVVPRGAMYIMVGIDVKQFKDIKDDAEFCDLLVKEQSVICLPGQCFKYPNYFRVVFTNPIDNLEAACERIAEFCKEHHI